MTPDLLGVPELMQKDGDKGLVRRGRHPKNASPNVESSSLAMVVKGKSYGMVMKGCDISRPR